MADEKVTRKIKKLTKTIDETVNGEKKAVNYDVQVESAIRDGEGHRITSYYATKADQTAELAKKQDNLTAGTAIEITTTNTVNVKADETEFEVNAAGNLQVKEVAASKVVVDADATSGLTKGTVQEKLQELKTAVSEAGKVDKLKLGDITVEPDDDKVVNIAVDGTYDDGIKGGHTANKIATKSTVTSAIEALDVDIKDTIGETETTALSAGKTLATLSETDGKIAATFQEIKITSSQVSDLDTTFTTKIGELTGSATIATADADTGIVTINGGIKEAAGKISNDAEKASVEVYTKAQTDTLLNTKIDIDGDKVLSDNNYTDADKNKLAAISEDANKVEATAKTGKISIDGTEIQIIPDDTVTDDAYKHITVTAKSADDATSTNSISAGTGADAVKIDNIVSDAEYKHITVTDHSVSDGTITISNIVSDDSYKHIDLDPTYVANSTSENGLTHKAISTAVEDVRAVAMGKTKTFVITLADQPALETGKTWSDDSVVVAKLVDTDGHDIVPAGKTVGNNTFVIKVGDNVFITDTQVPDRWVSAVGTDTITLSKLETTKVDLNGYMEKDTDATSGNIAVFDNAGNVIDSGYQLNFEPVTLTDVTD